MSKKVEPPKPGDYIQDTELGWDGIGGPPPADWSEDAKAALEVDAIRIRNKLDRLRIEKMEREAKFEATSLFDNRLLDFAHIINDDTVGWACRTLGRMAAANLDPITIRVNSPGGYITDAFAFYDYLRTLEADGIHITMLGLGIVASGAALVFQAGKRRVIAPNSFMLIHEASSELIGKTSELEDAEKFHKTLEDRMLGILASQSKMSPVAIKRKWRKTDWWMVSEEVVKNGFADEVGYR